MVRSWCFKVPPFIIIILYLFLSVYSVSPWESNHRVQEDNKLEKKKIAKEYLRKINEHAKKTIKSPDGDLIDCIPFHKQPAFNNPLLKGKISMVPPKMLNTLNSTFTFQLWNANGEKCPKGTIPIRRTIATKKKKQEDILRASHLERFGMKHNHFSNYDDPNTHEYATARSSEGNWTKSKATFNIWQPHVEVDDEMSLCQLWVIAGSNFNKLNAVEAGFHVYPDLYRRGKHHTRFFIYWTNNNYLGGHGCYNLLCAGFVQIDHRVAIGGTISTISTFDGHQYEITLSIEWKEDRNWWLFWESDATIIPVGYWPGVLFDHLNGPALILQYGGEIVNLRNGGHHTVTQMGSGHFSQAGFGRAAYVSEIKGEGHGGSSNETITMFTTDFNCYDIRPTGIPHMGFSFFYGGPGLGPQCP